MPGGGAVDIHPLLPGLVNQCSRVVRDGQHYSLRIAAAGSELGVERAWECAVRARAGAAGLAPTLRICEPQAGVLVADWVTGRAWSTMEAAAPANIDLMAQLLRRVHALEIPQPARCVGPADWIALYQSAMQSSAAQSCSSHAATPNRDFSGAAGHLASLATLPARPSVLCHSDLHRHNLVIGERPVLLDWEFAHVSDGFWDLAGWTANNDWHDIEAERLLTGYLQRTPVESDRARLRIYRWLYDFVCVLWSDLYLVQRPGTQAEALRASRDRLVTRLGRS